jgi:putative FmdB family regulatory protein
MPIYEYQCQKCHHHLEALQKISDKPLRECPECGKHTLQRLMSAPMFRLVGSGWYETDFKSDKESKRNLAGKDEAPPAESPAVTKSEKSEKAENKVETKAEPASAGKSTAVKKPASKPVAKPRPAAKKSTPKKAVRRR